MSHESLTSERAKIKDAFISVQTREGIAKAHQKKRAELLRDLASEEEMEQLNREAAINGLATSLEGIKVGGGVPAIVRLSYEQVILAFVGDLLWVYQKESGEWVEHLYGAADEDEGRVCDCGKRIRWPKINVAQVADTEPPELPGATT